MYTWQEDYESAPRQRTTKLTYFSSTPSWAKGAITESSHETIFRIACRCCRPGIFSRKSNHAPNSPKAFWTQSESQEIEDMYCSTICSRSRPCQAEARLEARPSVIIERAAMTCPTSDTRSRNQQIIFWMVQVLTH